jgi:pullulanase/glycogen debranching enzyme
MRVHRGDPYPLGATWNGRGVNLAVVSEVAEQVELCLFDGPGSAAESEPRGRPWRSCSARCWTASPSRSCSA